MDVTEIARIARAVTVTDSEMSLTASRMGQTDRFHEIGGEEMSREQIEQKDIIIQKLKNRGCRITRQRKVLLDIILGEECTSCKEI